MIVVSGLSRYRPALGTASGWTGDKCLASLGKLGGTMPPLFKLPDAHSSRQALEPKPMVIPTWSEWNVHYGVRPERSLIPIQGEELMTADTENAGRALNTPLPGFSTYTTRLGTVLHWWNVPGKGHSACSPANHRANGAPA